MNVRTIARSADVSPCGRYRHSLSRTFDAGKDQVAFVLLNPSTADGLKDDPTVRRCIGFAAAWGYRRLVIVNLFPYRATYPREMFSALDPLGIDADRWILASASESKVTVCAWGAWGQHRNRGAQVRHLLRPFITTHLGLCANGQPRHPLYLRGDVEPQVFPTTEVSCPRLP